MNLNNYDYICDDNYEYYINYKYEMPTQGWKIHISIDYKNIELVYNIVKSYLIKENKNFKILKIKKYKESFLGVRDKLSFGKFITIYTIDEVDLSNTLAELYKLLKYFGGPYVLTDEQYLDSRSIYYRYGKFKLGKNEKEKYLYKILDDLGNYVDDIREVGKYHPDFIKPPIFENKNTENMNEELLNDKYKPYKILAEGNSGAVYLSENIENNNVVVLKEASYGLGNNKEYSSKEILRNEYAIINYLDSENIVQALDYFEAWDNAFLVLEYIEGIKGIDIGAIFPYYSNGKLIKNIIQQLLLAINNVHKKDVIIGDLSSNNFILNKNNKIKLIDFGAAQFINQENMYTSFTFGFGNKELTMSYDLLMKDRIALASIIVNLYTRYNYLLNISIDIVLKNFRKFCDKYIDDMTYYVVEALYTDEKYDLYDLSKIIMYSEKEFLMYKVNKELNYLEDTVKQFNINLEKFYILEILKMYNIDVTSYFNCSLINSKNTPIHMCLHKIINKEKENSKDLVDKLLSKVCIEGNTYLLENNVDHKFYKSPYISDGICGLILCMIFYDNTFGEKEYFEEVKKFSSTLLIDTARHNNLMTGLSGIGVTLIVSSFYLKDFIVYEDILNKIYETITISKINGDKHIDWLSESYPLINEDIFIFYFAYKIFLER